MEWNNISSTGCLIDADGIAQELIVDPDIIVIDSDDSSSGSISVKRKNTKRKNILKTNQDNERLIRSTSYVENSCSPRRKKSYDSGIIKNLIVFRGADHLMREPRGRFECCYCCFAAPSLLQLREHLIRNHPGFRRFKCSDCEFSTWKRRELKEHQRSKHTFETPFECRDCGYRARRKSSLIAHVRQKHIGHLPFMCPFCSYGTVKAQIISRHIEAKHLFKPYKCNQCTFSFLSSSLLSNHIKSIHFHDESSGVLNSTKFPSVDNYDPERPFNCKICSADFALPQHLNRHIKAIHENVNYFQYPLWFCT